MKIFRKLQIHFITWNMWRKRCDNRKLDKFVVLMGLCNTPTFEATKMAVSAGCMSKNMKQPIKINFFNDIWPGVLIVVLSIILMCEGFILSDYRSKFEEASAANKETIKTLEAYIKELEEVDKEKNLVLEKQSVNVVEKKSTEETPLVVDLTIEEKLEASCEKYGVPFDIVLAIARLETGWFKSDAYIYRNNPGGMSVNEIPLSYSTVDEGVEAMVSNLANNYFGIGLITPELIGSKYCPGNTEWSELVRELMGYV